MASATRRTSKGKYLKSASFSGRSSTMTDIAEELEAIDVRRSEGGASAGNGDQMVELLQQRTAGDKNRRRPHKSTGSDAAYLNGPALAADGSNSPTSDRLDADRNQEDGEEGTPPLFFCNNGDAATKLEFSYSSSAYPGVSPVYSNRRVLGRKRGVSNGTGAENETEIKHTGAPATAAAAASFEQIKHVPSSLFYFQYDAEADDGRLPDRRRRVARKDIPTSRKFSAASNYSFFEDDYDEDEEDDEEEGEEVEREEKAEGEQTNRADDISRKIREEEEKTSDTSNDLYRRTLQEIDATTKVFRLSDDTYRQVKTLLSREMDNGLSRTDNHSATVKMYPTYVTSLPDGTEVGRYLALDLGGTNFRVLLVELRGRQQLPEVTSKLCLIPTKIMSGTGTALFDHIANCIAEFLDETGLRCNNGRSHNQQQQHPQQQQQQPPKQRIPLGFTFSFPCVQDGLASARLVRWTKGFSCSGVENEDVVRLLQEAIARKGNLDIDCVAVINDNVGVLMSAAHTDRNCRVGLILGTGTNCCYMENLDKVDLWTGDTEGLKQVIINTEWGAFGDNGILDFLRNSVDRQLDRESINPGHQLFEKMISGMYMGELVRLLLCELTSKGLLFGGEGSEELFQRNRFYTKYISEIESDDPLGPLTNTRQVLEELNVDRFTRDDCRYVQHACWQVSQRAAFLAGTAVASVIERTKVDHVTVAVDGSLYRFHPHFKDLMRKKTSQLLPENQKFKLTLANDGSGKGAAIVAAVMTHEVNRRH